MSTYNADQLRLALAVWKEGGYLDSGQIQALLDSEETPDDARPGLKAKLEEQRLEEQRLSIDTTPAPLTAPQRDLLPESGLEPEPDPELRSMFQRLGSAIRGVFSR